MTMVARLRRPLQPAAACTTLGRYISRTPALGTTCHGVRLLATGTMTAHRQRFAKRQPFKDIIFAGVQNFVQEQLRISLRQIQVVRNASCQIMSLHEVHGHLR